MKTIHGFLFVSYLISIIETGTLFALPVFALYLVESVDPMLGLVALVLGGLVAGLALVGLLSLENLIGERVDDERASRRRAPGIRLAHRVRA